MRRLAILGSTGSIGAAPWTSCAAADEFEVFALVAGRNAGLLAAQIVEFKPRLAVVANRFRSGRV